MVQQTIANGGVQYVPQTAVQQIVYLDFDGELTSYNGEILTVENVEVQNSGVTAERIADIVAELNARYADKNILFVTEKPTVADYSTIFIGKTDAFSSYGDFAGLAETIDKDNQISTDKAFVMLDFSASNEAIISTISHETDHLTGTLDHGGNGLAAYADLTVIDYGTTSTGLVVSSGTSLTVSSGGVVSDTTVLDNYYQAVIIESGGSAVNTILSAGAMNIFGVADNTVNSGGKVNISSGGTANSTTVNTFMHIFAGGSANDTTVNSGSFHIYNNATACNTTVNGGDVRIYQNAIHRGSLQIASGTVVSAYGGSVIDFTLTGCQTTGDYLINDLSRISGKPTYTITVSSDQAYGNYKLAQGAE
ncbi:MAG: hypothetical protein IKC94_06140, partial [Lentisphaeria bacterium]|nr:hypothetical protein [Lentisphaeria bacterium]